MSLGDRPMTWGRGDLEVTTDRSRIAVDQALALLRTTFWGSELSRERLARAIENSVTFGVLDGARLVGFARVVSDLATYAYWTDQGTITGVNFQSGTLDLTARESAGGSDNLSGTGPNNWNYTALTISDMIPNESISKTVVVRNGGTAPFRFNAKVKSSDNDLTSGSDGLQVIVFDNSTAAAQTGSQSGGNRAGTCSGGSQVFSGFVSTTNSSNIFGSDISLPNQGDTRSLCVRVVLASSAPNSLQNKNTDVVLTFDTTQLGAP